MRALVTGASGFVGSTLVEALAERGNEPVALLRTTSSTANLEGLRYQRAEGDLRDPAALEKAVKDVDVVFHVAGAVMERSAEAFHLHNAAGTRNVAEAIAKSGRPTRLIYVSSLAAAGPASSREGRTEEEPETPVSHYGRSKLEGEREALRFKDAFPVAIVRPPIVYGPRDKLVFQFIQAAARNVQVLLRGEKFYSTVHVADLCRGLIAAAEAEHLPSGERYFVAADAQTSLADLYDRIAEALGKKPLRVTVPLAVARTLAGTIHLATALTGKAHFLNPDKVREMAEDYWTCRNAKAKRQLNFAPRHELATGIAETVAWYRSAGWLR